MNRDELKRHIGITGYSLGQVEKDYFQHMILGALSRRAGGGLVFKGGTALQKLGIIPRFSEDLDFTARYDPKIQKLKDYILRVIHNYNFLAEANNFIDDERTAGFRIKIQGPLFRNRQGLCTIRIEISKRESVISIPENKEFNPPYLDILPYSLNIMHKEEILAEKIRAIYSRHKARDLYDIYKLLEIGTIYNIDLANEKLDYYNLQFDTGSFIENCEKLKPDWERDLQSLMQNIVPYNNVLNVIKERLLKDQKL